jgi:HD-like signal output (HDOD) protein
LVGVLQVAGDPECAADELARAVSWEPSLAGKVLALVNSAYVGLAHRVGSLQQATATLAQAEAIADILMA